ncbi:hypothetical protein ACQPXB_21215 [Amycolatopsis sp. CA-161197]|uniref:hypothetical protein n=1 Tax=Amycolatopsis sp. CA-161197 TaxID=3239922 RepID=UPI003D8EB866
MNEKTATTSEEQPHLEALQRAVEAGFVRVPLQEVSFLFFERVGAGHVETIKVESMTRSSGARWAESALSGNSPRPFWQVDGEVAMVVNEVLSTAPAPQGSCLDD